MDIDMPKLNGMQACKQINKFYNENKVEENYRP